MGCCGSKSQKEEPGDSDVDAPQQPQQPVVDEEETKALVKAIFERLVNIRTKAEEYASNLQTEVAAIEREMCTSMEDQPVRVNGVVIIAYKPETEVVGAQILEADAGEDVEIIVRDMGGWTYCRRKLDPKPGWLPADRVTELATLVADHDVQDEGLLSLKCGEVVEVLSRHYSGWAQCRIWTGGAALPGKPDDGQIGWVTDAYLKDDRSEAMLATKWHRLVLQALEQVAAYSQQLEAYLSEPIDWTVDPAWQDKCMEFCIYLSNELQSITDALSQHGLQQNSAGCYAEVTGQVVPGGEHELGVEEGQRVLIVDADHAEWFWCQTVDQDPVTEGWVPRNVLMVEPGQEDVKKSEKKRTTMEDLPGFIKVGELARWWSASGQRYCDVTISVVDAQEALVTVVFVQDSSCWKTVPFEHFQQPGESWQLQPMQDKAQELLHQLPSWVKASRQAYWWSESQHRVMPVTIKDVNSKRRLIAVVFAVNKSVKKVLPFHELVDNPEKCLLQKERSGHDWRKPRKSAGGDQNQDEILDGSEIEDLGAHAALGDLMTEMTQDIGDMMGPESGFSANPNDAEHQDLRKALSNLEGIAEQPTVVESPESLVKPSVGSEVTAKQDNPAWPAVQSEVIAQPDSSAQPAVQTEVKQPQNGPVTLDDRIQVPATGKQAAPIAAESTSVAEGSMIADPITGAIEYTTSEQDMMESFDAPTDKLEITTDAPLYDTMDKKLLEELVGAISPAGGPQAKALMAQEDKTALAEVQTGLTEVAAVKETLSSPPEANNDSPSVVASSSEAALQQQEQQQQQQPHQEQQQEQEQKLQQQPKVLETPAGPLPSPSTAPVSGPLESGEHVVSQKLENPESSDALTGAEKTVFAPEGEPRLPAEAALTSDHDTLHATDVLPASQQNSAGAGSEAPAPPNTEAWGSPAAPRVQAWDASPAPPPQGPAPSPEEMRNAYLQELRREHEKADAAALATAADAAKNASATAKKQKEDEEEPLGIDTLQAEMEGATVIVREALRLVVPDTWDSDEEARTGRRHPDLSMLSSCWELLEEDLKKTEDAENERMEAFLDRQAKAAEAKIEARATDLKEKLELRAKTAESKLDTNKAQSMRSMAWNVVNAAEGAKELKQTAKATRVGLARRKVQSRRLAIRKALSADPTQVTGKDVLELQLPSGEALGKVSPFDALVEVSEAIRACFKSLQVVALRPPEAVADKPAPGAEEPTSLAESPEKQSAWGDSNKDETSGAELASSLLTALPEIRSCLTALAGRLTSEKENKPEVDQTLRVVATDEDVMTKDQKREKIMFEGQQEYDWARGVGLKVEEQSKRRQAHVHDSLDRLSKVLHRRWKREHEREKAKTMSQLAALSESMDDTEAALNLIKKEEWDVANSEAEALEAERRRLQEQTRTLMSAALFIRAEKERINKAWNAEPREKKTLLLQSLKTIRRLNQDMKALPVLPELKEKHSVLLYSLRMLEARLAHDCVGSTAKDIQEEPLEETPAMKNQLDAAEAAAEEQLWADVEELHTQSRSKAERAMAREAARRRVEAEATLAPVLLATKVAVRSTARAARRAELAAGLLRPLGMLSAQLEIEAYRHAVVDRGQEEPGSFVPKWKRLDDCLGATLKGISDLAPKLESARIEDLTSQSGSLGVDSEWATMLEKTEQRWQEFCKTYSTSVADEQDTPRGEGNSSPKPPANLNATLEIDDLEVESPTSTAPSLAATGKIGRGGGGHASKNMPPPPTRQAPPNRPPSAGANRPPASSKAPVPNSGARGARPPPPDSAAQTPKTPAGGKKGADLLAQLDAVSAQMDRTLGKNGTFSRTQANGFGVGAGPTSGKGLKPPGAKKR